MLDYIGVTRKLCYLVSSPLGHSLGDCIALFSGHLYIQKQVIVALRIATEFSWEATLWEGLC